VVAGLCGEVLVEIGDDVAVRVALLLDEDEAETRRRAAVLLADLPHAASREQVVAGRLARHALEDPAWFVRAEAALSLGTRGSRGRDTRPARGVLERALEDSDPAVVEFAVLGLRELDDPRAVPALAGTLERAVERGEGAVLRESLQTLKDLTGETADLDPEGWRAWWRQHGVEVVGRPE
jgi:HEAT repeat protein